MSKKKWFPSRWTKVRPLPEGGQSWPFVVQRADSTDTKLYVLKRLKNKKRLKRFKEETDALTRLAHPGILKLIETGESGGEAFFIAEYCSNGDLSNQELFIGKSLLEKLKLFREICDAVRCVHKAKLIHRDIKHTNVLVREDNSIALGDFGLCLDIDDLRERSTRTTERVGSWGYIAPELEEGRIADPEFAVDCFSLGKLLFYLLSGKVLAHTNYNGLPHDLRSPDSDPYLEFVYTELFPRSITDDPSKRFKNAFYFTEAVDSIIMRIEQNAHVLNPSIPQHCLFCVVGKYHGQITSTNEYMLVCNNCHNVQKFMTRNFSQTVWWKL